MAETASPIATPKRKRDDLITEMRLETSPISQRYAKAIFSLKPNLSPTKPSGESMVDGNSSPRSKVAQKFMDLSIRSSHGNEDKEDTDTDTHAMSMGGSDPESGGGAAVDAGAGAGHSRRGRINSQTKFMSTPDISTRSSTKFDFGADIPTDHADADMQDMQDMQQRLRDILMQQEFQQDDDDADKDNNDAGVRKKAKILKILATEIPALGPTSDNIDTIVHSSLPHRAILEPIHQSIEAAIAPVLKPKDSAIVDPVRAALTWRKDEITVYDPEDKDDDGTGINGIGFRPTPAVAYQRSQKRRQQLVEYKKREENEARARRNQRRGDQLDAGARMAKKKSIARVRFADTAPTVMIT